MVTDNCNAIPTTSAPVGLARCAREADAWADCTANERRAVLDLLTDKRDKIAGRAILPNDAAGNAQRARKLRALSAAIALLEAAGDRI